MCSSGDLLSFFEPAFLQDGLAGVDGIVLVELVRDQLTVLHHAGP